MDNFVSEMIVSTSYSDIDKEFVVRELHQTDWAKDRPKETILLSLTTSLCYSCFYQGKQVGFMRVITDSHTFAYLCDVVVALEYRGKGVGKKMMKTLSDNPELQKLNWVLRTVDAHGLYEQFGFKKTFRPERYMEKEMMKISSSL